VLSRLPRMRLSPFARTALALTAAGAALALTPAPPATSLPLPAAGHRTLAQTAPSVTSTADQCRSRPQRG